MDTPVFGNVVQIFLVAVMRLLLGRIAFGMHRRVDYARLDIAINKIERRGIGYTMLCMPSKDVEVDTVLAIEEGV